MRAILLAIILAGLTIQPVHADPADDTVAIIETIYAAASRHGVSGMFMERLARCESRLDPNAVGDNRHSVGLFQIHDQGLLPLFRQWGYDDRADPWQAADFTARALAAGLRSHWHC